MYHEPEYIGNMARMTYLCDMQRLIEQKQAEARTHRDELFADFEHRQPQLREQYRAMLGWPLSDPQARRFTPTAKMSMLGSDDEADLYRVEVEVLPGFHMQGILLRRTGGEKLPLVICQHGGQGTPEQCAGMYDGGKTFNYNDMTRRILARNVHVFSPQLLLWRHDGQEKYHVHFDRGLIERQLKQLGGSIAALEIHGILQCIESLRSMDWVDAERIGFVGLSYGGFYALYTAAADPRIKSTLSSAYFNDRTVYPWHDWIWKDAANTFLDAEVGALVAPRGLHLQLGTRDELFQQAPAEAEYLRLQAYYHRIGHPQRLSFERFNGIHEFSPHEESIDRFMKDLLG